MNRLIPHRILVLACILMLPLAAFAQLPTPTYSWNLGSTLEPPGGKGAWRPAATRNEINAAADAGFNTVRIPCAWNSHANQSTYVIDSTYMARVKQVVDWCVARNLYVVINCHWDNGWLENNITNTVNPTINAKMQSYWTQIANTFKNYDGKLIFAGANEPNVDTAAEMTTLATYSQTFINAVRATGGNNSTRSLVIQGSNTDIDMTESLMNIQPWDSATGRLMVGARVKPRIIVTQDGEGDDQDSMVRFLLYSSDYDVVGIIENNSIFQQKGHSGSKWIQKKIDAYAKVLPNLRAHNPDFPDAEYLKSIIRLGNENPGDLMKNKPPYTKSPADFLTKDTPGSDLIIKTLLDNDPRPVHVPSWGGANTTAYALWKIKTTMPDKWPRAASRIRIHGICYNLTTKAQDGGFKWIIDNLPEVKIFQSAWWSRTWNYSSVGSGSWNPPDVQRYMDTAWLMANVKTGHGPLGEIYGQSYVSEGDTPSWLNLINNGLDADTDYTLGGWGGRAVYKQAGWMVDGVEDPTAAKDKKYSKAFFRWIPAAQNDFAARMDWCKSKNYKDANHNPVLNVDAPLVRTVAPGETVKLNATATDPDGNKLTYLWWQYHEADSAASLLAIANANTPQASFVVPNERGKQLQLIIQVTDNGTPALTTYRRVLCNIK